MKKSLLAIAAMTAFAGAAQAQSSVTVYGILDVGFAGSNYSGTSVTANVSQNGGAASAGTATTKQVAAGFTQSAESTSRIGFKGAEDLGGGLSALFTVEMGLSPMQQTVSSSASTALAFDRQAFVGLKKAGLGTVSIGNQYSPIFDVQSITDAAGNNNMVGNAVYSGSLQSSTGTFNSAQGPFAGAVASTGLNVDTGAYVTRYSNSLKFQSERMAGVVGELFYAQSNQSNTNTQAANAAFTTGAGGVNNSTAFGANADYVWKKLQVVAAYQQSRNIDQNFGSVVNNAATSTIVIANGTAGGTSGFGVNMGDQQTYAAATYDFGILKAYYQYVTRKVVSVQDSSYFSKRSANQIGVKSQLTPVISAFATMGLGNAAYFGNGLAGSTQGANFRTFQVGADYFLSKRTNLYAIVGAVNQSSNGSNNAANTTVLTQSANGGVGVSASNYAVGIRHTF